MVIASEELPGCKSRRSMSAGPAAGLCCERARWYSSNLGTWISQDPLQYINGANTYQFVMGNPVGAVYPWGLFYGSISGPLPVGKGHWVRVAKPDVPLGPGQTEWYRDFYYKQFLGVKATHGMAPGGNFALKLLKKVIKKVPFVPEVRAWASAIESDLTLKQVQYLFRLEATFTVRRYAVWCSAKRQFAREFLPWKTEIRNLRARWKANWPGPGELSGMHPIVNGVIPAEVDVAKSLLDLTKEFLK